jgi:ectoine hydroxylase-related dioxygenase (phytanoyl-CoA dioxygenase family)
MQNELIIDELIHGSGYFIIKNYFNTADINYSLKFVRKASSRFSENVKERRVWNMHLNNNIFKKFAYPEIAVEVYNVILGKKHKLNTFGANRLMPGSIAQEPHADYPYWGIFDLTNMPMNFNSSFSLACQTLIPLTEYNNINGAIEVVPGTQKLCQYPNFDNFEKNKIILELSPGDLLLYHSLLWHRAGSNKSTSDRVSLLGQYTAYFVETMR